MASSFRDELTRLSNPAVAERLSGEAERVAGELAGLAAALPPDRAAQVVALFWGEVIRRIRESDANGKSAAGTPDSVLTPAVLEWARQQFNEQEVAAGIEEIRATGGLTLHDFYGELERLAAPE